MRTRAQAEYEWFYGEPASPDVGEEFRAGWDALASEPNIAWCREQIIRGRKLVSLISPQEANGQHRYAGYYCEDAPMVIWS